MPLQSLGLGRITFQARHRELQKTSGSYEVGLAMHPVSAAIQRNRREVSDLNFSWVMVLCGVSFAWPAFTPIRPEHTPQARRSHATPSSQDPRKVPSTEGAPGAPNTKERMQPDVLRNSGLMDQFSMVQLRGRSSHGFHVRPTNHHTASRPTGSVARLVSRKLPVDLQL